MLAPILNGIIDSTQLGGLFLALGYVEDDLPFVDCACTVARWKGFKVVAADADVAIDGVRSLARKLACSSERALAAVVGADRELALAAPRLGRAGITRVFTLSLDSPSEFAIQQLERLRPNKAGTALEHAFRVAQILSSEAVGNRFFTRFRLVLERMAAAIDKRRSIEDRRMVALLNLTRILFLYFVQAKGWMDGKPDFLVRQLNGALAGRINFHRKILHPLFFGTLNQPPCHRSKHLKLGTIPYLNGGLFEPHTVERDVGLVCFPNAIWRDAFDNVFERFRFCVREADELDAIAPDMLGRVFERLMNAAERHESGTYYTPESIVRQLVVTTIETALSSRLSPRIAQQLVSQSTLSESDARSARSVLRTMRILDPAVGSGAFLLEALDVLSTMRYHLEARKSPANRLRVRKEILRKNLMGVDLNPVAVRLAELRLWLAVVADDPTTAIHKVAPLPNLDGVVRQGDTLLDPIAAARLYSPNSLNTSDKAAEAVGTFRQSLFNARGRDHRSGVRRLRKAECELARRLLEEATGSTIHAIDDLASVGKSRDLFGKRTGLSTRQRERHRVLKRLRRELDLAKNRLKKGALPFFSFEVHAPDVLSSGGFTVVVGNPPWVRAEQLPPTRRRAIKERYQWWRSGNNLGFAHLPDLSVAFLERCLELTAKGGSVGLLLPSKVASAGYGETVRRGLVRETSIAYIHRVPDQEAVRFGATTYPLALVLKKETPSDHHRVHIGFSESHSVKQRDLDVPGPWILHKDKTRNALEDFQAAGYPLARVAAPTLGVKTGADGVFVGKVVEILGDDALVAFADNHAVIERTQLRPVLRGRDIRHFAVCPTRAIVWCLDPAGKPLERLSDKASQHFALHTERLRTRSDYQGGPVWTVFRTRGALADHRVVWPDIARCPKAVVLEETETVSAVPLNTCYVAPAPDRETSLVIAAVLNSTWSAAFATAHGDEARGHYRRINARLANRIPIPRPGPARAELAELSRRAHRNEDVRIEDLDEAVAVALGLSSRAQRALQSLANNNG